LLAAVAVMGWLALQYFRLGDEPVALLLAVVGPLATAGLAVTAALVIHFHAVFGLILRKAASLIFWGGVAGLIVSVWAAVLLFRLVDRIELAQDEPARLAHTAFGGELTTGEIQAYLTGDPT